MTGTTADAMNCGLTAVAGRVTPPADGRAPRMDSLIRGARRVYSHMNQLLFSRALEAKTTAAISEVIAANQ